MKTHLNLATRDLNASVAFYRTLLDAAPAKHFEDYALFVTDDPGLELALDSDPAARVAEGSHFGIAVESPEQVEAAAARLRRAGAPIDIEVGETCCYAVQNKVWATDPDGRRWETYFVVAETEEREEESSTCCRTEAATSAASPSCC
jgi:catechol 2,3-dioxygenase-like lactoylglutathione lyase family enzyme